MPLNSFFLKIIQILFFSLILVSCTTHKLNQKKSDLHKYYIADCKIYNAEFEVVRVLIGTGYCIPLKDGGWLTKDKSKLMRFKSDGTLLWQYKGRFHHQLLVDQEGNYIAVTESITKIGQLRYQFDTIYKFSDAGLVLESFSMFKSLPFMSMFNSKNISYTGWAIQNSDLNESDIMISRINSAHEVPVKLKEKYGEYVFHDANMGACFSLTKKLKLTGWFVNTNAQGWAFSHDCQILEDESILYYANPAFNVIPKKSFKIIKASTNHLFEFPDQAEDFYFAPFRGGVEYVGKNFLFSASNEESTIIGLIDENKNWLKKKIINYEFQDIKVIKINNYLELNLLN